MPECRNEGRHFEEWEPVSESMDGSSVSCPICFELVNVETLEPAYSECLDGRDDGSCGGMVEYRMALSSSGRNFPRCDTHWAKRIKTQERIDRDYPDSPIPPSWFDAANAGEHWDYDY